MRELLVATGNEGKVRELRAMLAGMPFAVVGLQEKGIIDVAPENEDTFEGNAQSKAHFYGDRAGVLTLAEDSGLEIDALDGRPGVHTKEYAEGTPDQGFQKIFDEMKDVPDERRGAQFTSVIVIYDPLDKKERTCRAHVRGTITREARGTHGFGQDPIFQYDATGKTGGEMTLEEKNVVSHRRRSFDQARELLQEFV